MRLVRLLLLFSFISFFISLPIAQAQLALDPTLERGLKPYGSFEGGNIDSVAMTNGNLNLHIPLASYPQRGGKLHLGFYVKYNNNSYVHTPQAAAGCNVRPFTCEYGDAVAAPGIGIVPDFDLTTYVSGVIPPSNGSYATIKTSDGSQHEMGATANGWRTIDATGYLCLSNCAIVIDREGIRYNLFTSTGNPQRIEDPNGNFITASAGTNGVITSYADTLNRSIPVPPTPYNGAAPTSDFSGCTGTLATASAYLWTLTGYQGGPLNFKICYATVYYGGQDCIKANGHLTCTIRSSSTQLIQSIALPNNTAWTFQYDSDNPSNPVGKAGNLLQVTFPTGGYIKYTWGAFYICQTPTSTTLTTYTYAVTSRTVNANDGTGDHTTSYSFANVSAAWNNSPYSTSSTDPLGQKTVHTMTALGGTCSFYETQAQTLDSTGAPIKTVTTDYHANQDPMTTGPPPTNSSNVVPIRVTTAWPNGQVSKVETDYDSGVALTGNQSGFIIFYGNPIAKREYDYGSGAPGPLLRSTTTAYQPFSNSSYLNNNLLTLPSSITVADGSGTTQAITNYSYDQSGLASSNVTMQFDTAPPDGSFRGNPTTIQRWQNLPTSGYLSTTTSFFDTGTVYQVTDPGGHTTTSAYSLAFYGAYLTQVTNALTQSVSRNYDFNTGLVISTTDLNNLTTTLGYDSMLRLSQVNHPDGGQETITRQESSFPFTTTLTKKINSSQNAVTTSVSDGVGRVTQSQLTSDPQGTVFADTTYDALGRVATVSNPYRQGTDPTSSPGITSYTYDALSRKTRETYPDGSVTQTAYCGASTLVTDPVGKWRRSSTDGLGRLVEVDEPNAPGATVAAAGCPGSGEPIWVTSYTNDTLGNLTQIVQNGSHQRNFTYNSLSQLLTSANPEVGTITYTYDANGNVLTKTDARNITVTSAYDALNRETSRTYSNGDPAVSITYDQSNCLGLTQCQNIGHRTGMTDAAGSEAWSFDVPDRIHKEQRTTSSITKTATYNLDFAGNITSVVYPTGRTINYTYDAANRPITAADASNGITYATSQSSPPSGCLANAVCYTPQGSAYSMAIGKTATFTGLNLSDTFNSRLQPIEFKATSTAGNAMDITYNFVDPVTSKNAGHVFGIANNLNSTRSQLFTYDQVNRITSAGTSATTGANCWGYQYTYDAWGNLLSQAGWTPTYNGCTEPTLAPITADGNNHISGLTYDVSGNTLTDGANTYTWDAESQMKTAAGVTYTYDGDGRRVSKSNGKLYWYGSGGEILTETNAAGNVQNEYVYFGGKRIADLPASSTPLYYAEDFLGSSRVITQNNGAVCYDADFYPYGGERAVTNTCPQNYKFEGKERDTETGNDDFGARYYSSRIGRWLSSDWSAVPVPVPYANLTNPQTLNLYSLVSDDPESFADLDGHDCATYGQITVCWNRSEFASLRLAEDSHEYQHRKDNKSGENLPGWKKEQRAFEAEILTLELRLSELEEKEKNGGLTDTEKREKAAVRGELSTVKTYTEGPEADKNAQRYYRDVQNPLHKLFIPSPDKDNKVPGPKRNPPSVEPGKKQPCVGCEKPKHPKDPEQPNPRKD